MKRIALLAALGAALAAAPAQAGGPAEYSYGIDGYERCQAAAGTGNLTGTYYCADRLVFELTDGGQLRRLPYCYADAAESISLGLTSPLRRTVWCNETWLGTNLEPR